jgi:AraC family carnitine catabolism transcriptional activator
MPHVCFVVRPRFQKLAHVFVSKTLRIANKRAGRNLSTWETRSATSEPVEASNGQLVTPDVGGWPESSRPDLVLVMAGYEPMAIRPGGLGAFLKRCEAAGAILGGVDTGVAVVASFDVLRGHRIVVHHEAEPGFRETWADIDVADRFQFDGRWLSTAGGTATVDAMLARIT